ncbi:MAG: hypothetical protein QXL67_03050 [Candidatus Bathyarchaeia archaeon]
MIEAVALHSFVGYHWRAQRASIGRGYKLDRQEIVGVVVALQNWVSTNHEKRIEKLHKKVRYLRSRLTGISGIRLEDMPDEACFSGFRITLENKTSEETAALYEKEIYGGDPRIALHIEGNSLILNVVTLRDGEEKILADKLRSILVNLP